MIACFLSLTEIALTIAATQTSGGIQIVLTIFVICFTVLVACAFFVILWNRPYVFYHPSEYGEHVSPIEYVEAMQRHPVSDTKIDTRINSIVKSTLSSPEMIDQLAVKMTGGKSGGAIKQATELLETAADTAVERIREATFITLDSRPLLGDRGEVWRVPYGSFRTVAAFLDDIYFALRADIPIFSYRTRWILRDTRSGKSFSEIGTRWARDNLGKQEDSRELKAVGIRPGMRIEITAPDNIGIE
jgi:hypothetical protein